MNSKTHINSHIVTLNRLGTFLSKAQKNSTGGSSFFQGGKESVGSYWESENSHKVGSGLTMAEEAILMPFIIDIPADDRSFRAAVTQFFNELTTNIPDDNPLELEIGLLVDNSKPISLEKDAATGLQNLPINIMDYIRYRHAKGHPWTAADKKSGEGNLTKKFYIFDKVELQTEKTQVGKQRDAAIAVYMKVKLNDDSIDQMLILMGEDIRKYNGMKNAEDLKLEALHKYATTDSVNFKARYDEGDIDIRAWISNMLTTGVLKPIGKTIIDPETNDSIGGSMDEAIYYFKDEKNSSFVGTLKARLQEANTKPVEEAKRITKVS